MKAFALHAYREPGGMRLVAGMMTAGEKKKEESREKKAEENRRE
jgi:hypothetical protein